MGDLNHPAPTEGSWGLGLPLRVSTADLVFENVTEAAFSVSVLGTDFWSSSLAFGQQQVRELWSGVSDPAGPSQDWDGDTALLPGQDGCGHPAQRLLLKLTGLCSRKGWNLGDSPGEGLTRPPKSGGECLGLLKCMGTWLWCLPWV